MRQLNTLNHLNYNVFVLYANYLFVELALKLMLFISTVNPNNEICVLLSFLSESALIGFFLNLLLT